jgi:hypothetical protein
MLSSDILAKDASAETMSREEIQELLAAAVRLYAAKVEQTGDFPAVPSSTITATDSMIASTGLLRAVNVQLFELGMWQSWSH